MGEPINFYTLFSRFYFKGRRFYIRIWHVFLVLLLKEIMKKENDPKDVKPDLKHDSMEYAASTEGEDRLDMDSETADEIEDEEISAEELELLEDDTPDDQAAALNTAELDRLADNDVSFEDDDEELEPGETDDDDLEIRR